MNTAYFTSREGKPVLRPMCLCITTSIFLAFPSLCMGKEKAYQHFLFLGRCKLVGALDWIRHNPPTTWHEVILPFILGTIVTFFLWKILPMQRILIFIHVLEHEMTHGLTAIACGGRFTSMTVSLDGGVAQVSKANIFVNLAPYCVPVFCAGVLIIANLLKPGLRIYGLVIAGILYGIFLKGSFSSIGIQSDIRNSGGKLICYPLIVVANMMTIILGAILVKVGY